MRAPAVGEKLHKCANCEFVHYCNKDCQRLAWKIHRSECKRLKQVDLLFIDLVQNTQVFPNLPLTEVLFLSKAVDKVVFIEEHGDKFGWQVERKFSDLMDHKEEIR